MDMATALVETPTKEPILDKVPEWKLAKEGLRLVLNNKQDEAEVLFKKYPDSIHMFAGYTFTIFMDALMTFEEEKLTLALSTLKELEKRCTMGSGWMKTMKTKMFGLNEPLALAQQLENQIILADCQVCIATLTFLQQDFTGYFKGGWVLRRGWKLYQHTYKEIQLLYVEIVGELPEAINVIHSIVSNEENDSSDEEDWQISSGTRSPSNGYIKKNTHSRPYSTNSDNTLCKNFVNYPKKCNCSCSNNNLHMKRIECHSKSTDFKSYQTSNNLERNSLFLKKSTSVNSALTSRSIQDRSSYGLFSRLPSFNTALSLSYFASALNIFSTQKSNLQSLDKETVKRLMGAVSFGYGLFQLGISLLPPSLLKFSNFLGFGGNLENGISNLMYSREGSDMRAPLASLSLLWYYSIVRPFYALDGSNLQAGVEVASQLIKESKKEYGQSALFLFFEGRVARLNSDIDRALRCFQASVDNTCQREIKVLSLHEVGWCHLIKLNYAMAAQTFETLKTMSRWSKAFYFYLSVICSGANTNIRNLKGMMESKSFLNSVSKGAQLKVFLSRRFACFPVNNEMVSNRNTFWKFFVYELLYLWNTLPSCYVQSINEIIRDCNELPDGGEPIVGVSYLMLGSCYCILKDRNSAIESFKKCLEVRKGIAHNAQDAHISAFAQYELGTLLVKDVTTKREGKELLEHVSSYKDYDFEQRLNVRIHDILKSL